VNDTANDHVPSTEFRAMLEREVVRAFQRESRFANPPGAFVRGRLRVPLILLAGLMLGWGSALVKTQVQSVQERDRLIESATADRRLLEMRLKLAEDALDQARTRFQVGVTSREALIAAEGDVRQLRDAIARLDLDVAETTASSAPVRNELWAPLVGGRDFVLERLKMDLASRQQRLSVSERSFEEAQRAFRVGTGGAGAVASAQADLQIAQRNLALAARSLELRTRFFEERLTPETLARELQRSELEAEAERTRALLRLAETRAALAKERMLTGTASELDFRRAELEVLELGEALKRLKRQMSELGK
jgi:outer membrane protein TolC